MKHLHQVPESKRTFPAIGSIKYDGVFAYCLPDGRIFSRTGKECFSLNHISKAVVIAADKCKAVGLQPHVIIGEVYVGGWPVQQISGSFRRQSQQFTEAKLMVHDAITVEDFVNGYSATPYVYRYGAAKTLAMLAGQPFVPSCRILTEADAYEMAEEVIQDGGEGIVLRNPYGVWQAGKRNADLTKIKQDMTFDLEVIGMKEGKGKYAGTLGTLTVRFNGHKQDISGMTDAQRDLWWADPSLIAFEIVEVQCMCLTPDGKMREPRFKMIRYDKATPDY